MKVVLDAGLDWKGNLPAKVFENAREQLAKAAFILEDSMKVVLSRPGSGRVYTHHFWTDAKGRLRRGRRRNQPHQASAPGEPPAPDTGTLRSSVSVDLSGLKDRDMPFAIVGPTAFYAAILEQRMNRPFMERSVRRALPAMKREFTREKLMRGID